MGNLKRIGEQYSAQDSGTLSIATTHTQARYVLPQPVARLREAYPKVNVSLHQITPDQVARMVIDEIAEIDQNALSLADGIAPEIHAVVLRSIENTKLGGGVWTQLRARDGSDIAIARIKVAIEQRETQLGAPPPSLQAGQTILAMVDFLAGRADDKQSEALRKLIDMLSRKRSLATRVARDIQYQAIMEIWLYIHVPLSVTLLGALTGHIISVFFYW